MPIFFIDNWLKEVLNQQSYEKNAIFIQVQEMIFYRFFVKMRTWAFKIDLNKYERNLKNFREII